MTRTQFRLWCLAGGLAVGTGLLHGQTWKRDDVDFGKFENRARELAQQPYRPPERDVLPRWMKTLSYDQYRDIRFRGDQSLWAQENLPFRAQFFHPGYIYREPVQIHEFTSSHAQEVRFTPAFFEYGHLVGDRGEVPANAGFAGVKFLAALNGGAPIDEMTVFQGTSYWRALGKGQHYGLSARGIAIDTGAEGASEEFPSFREFWLKKPSPGDNQLLMMAILDGPSVTGAYAFAIQPGQTTSMAVHAVLFPRKEVKRLGIAPLSSMYWFGENSRQRFDDFRPEVHDSDGLAIKLSTGECLWRPISNDSGKLEFSFFEANKLAGFGLLQRDRRFSSYEDAEAAYHKRPSVWIQPTNDWGDGSVMLMEIPTKHETSDNLVAMWVPKETPKPGQRYEFDYQQHWSMDEDPAKAGGHVVATRTGVHDWQPEQRTVAVEFTGIDEAKLTAGKDPEAVVNIIGAGADKAKIQGLVVQEFPDNRWRVSFQIAPKNPGAKLADVGPLELRAALKSGDNYLSETWVNRIQP